MTRLSSSAVQVISPQPNPDLLKQLQKEQGLGMLLITHDLAVVAGMAHRVALMYAGQIIEVAKAEDFFANPEHPYARALLRDGFHERPIGQGEADGHLVDDLRVQDPLQVGHTGARQVAPGRDTIKSGETGIFVGGHDNAFLNSSIRISAGAGFHLRGYHHTIHNCLIDG